MARIRRIKLPGCNVTAYSVTPLQVGMPFTLSK